MTTRSPSRGAPPPSRRRFLGGAAVALGLPFLESLAPRPARGAVSPRPKRLLVYHFPNGVHMKTWMPPDAGPAYTASPSLAPLAPVRSDVLVLSGLVNTPGVPPIFQGSHAGGCGALLTCTQVTKPEVKLAKSMDQVLADAIGGATRLRSLELGFTDWNVDCENWPCSYHQNISWVGPSTPAPRVTSVRMAFDRLFRGFDPNASAAEAERRTFARTSVLDVVLKDIQALEARLGGGDKRKLDEYLTAVRDVESSARKQEPKGPACTLPAQPTDPMDFPAHLSLMHDLIALAFQCDATRVISLTEGYALSGRSYPFLGITGDGHALTHHAGDVTKIDKVKKLDVWRVQQFVKLVQKLKALDDGDGKSVLYNSCVYYTSEIGDGDEHHQHNKPVLIAGQLGGFFKTGQHVVAAPRKPDGSFQHCGVIENMCKGAGTELGDFYTSLLNAYGVDIKRFGQSGTGPLPETLLRQIANV
jgi:hypothetical protein